jgi:hypothetical protein
MNFKDAEIDVSTYLYGRSQVINPNSTTRRFSENESYELDEVAYLILPSLEEIRALLIDERVEESEAIVDKIKKHFPELISRYAPLVTLNEYILKKDLNSRDRNECLRKLDFIEGGFRGRLIEGALETSHGWSGNDQIFVNSRGTPIIDDDELGFTITPIRVNSYWQSGEFNLKKENKTLDICFYAKTVEGIDKYKIYLFRNGDYYLLGEFIADTNWRAFKIPAHALDSEILKIQISQEESSETLSIKGIHINGVEERRIDIANTFSLPLEKFGGVGDQTIPCDQNSEVDCLEWVVNKKNGFVQTPVIFREKEKPFAISFEAKINGSEVEFSSVYLFENANYVLISNAIFLPKWSKYRYIVNPKLNAEYKIQIDYPNMIESIFFRNFKISNISLND